MHDIGKTIPELHAILKLAKKSIPKKALDVLAIRQGKIQKPTSQAQGKGKQRVKGKSKLAYDPKHKIPPSAKKSIMLRTLSVTTVTRLDTGRGTGLRGYRKLNKGALNLYVGNGNTTTIEAIGSYELILPSGMILVLYDCHFSPSITREYGVVRPFSNKIHQINLSPDLSSASSQHTQRKQRVTTSTTHLSTKFLLLGAKFFETNLIKQEASGCTVDFDEIQREDVQPSENHNLHKHKVEHDVENPQTDVILVHRSARIPQAPERYEMQSMKDNQVWNLVDLPQNYKTVGSKWLFKKKTDMDGNIHTYKARLVAKGFTQTHMAEYEETSSTAAYTKAIRILIAIAAASMGNNIPMLQDVKSWLGKCFTMKDLDLRKSQGPSIPAEVKQMKGIPYASAVGSIMYATDRDDLRSQTGFVFVMNEGVVDLKSSNIDKPMDMYCDNTSAITIADEPGVQKDAKHFQENITLFVKLFKKVIYLKVHTDNNLADPVTKPMPCTKHVEHARSIGLKPAGSYM
nr:hypothetical protein [Tanacetum cinerariifolium]